MARVVVGMTWSDAPHLSEQAKADLIGSYQEYQMDARTRGIPSLGAGAIYPFAESNIRIDDADIRPMPLHWRRAFALDTALSGWTAAVWGALDPETQIVYIYSVYKAKGGATAVHAEAMKARGKWIPGVGDAAAVVDEDRRQFLSLYREHGFDIILPDKSLEVGIQAVYNLLASRRLKVCRSCLPWFEEYRLYHRDENQRIVDENDHLMDATRYLIKSGLQRAKVPPPPPDPLMMGRQYDDSRPDPLGWMH